MLSHMLRASVVSKALDLTYIGDFTSASANGTTITFDNVSLGNPDPNRKIYAIVLARPTTATTANLTSGTVGGVSISVLAQAASGATNSSTHAGFGADVPTGTTATISVTFSTAVQASLARVLVYRVLNQVSSTATALVNSTTSNGTSGTVLTNTLTTVNGGFALNSLTLTSNVTMTYTNMPINSGNASNSTFTGGKENTIATAENFTFTLSAGVSGWKRFGFSLRG